MVWKIVNLIHYINNVYILAISFNTIYLFIFFIIIKKLIIIVLNAIKKKIFFNM